VYKTCRLKAITLQKMLTASPGVFSLLPFWEKGRG
jgi:hypothetical protein